MHWPSNIAKVSGVKRTLFLLVVKFFEDRVHLGFFRDFFLPLGTENPPKIQFLVYFVGFSVPNFRLGGQNVKRRLFSASTLQ